MKGEMQLLSTSTLSQASLASHLPALPGLAEDSWSTGSSSSPKEVSPLTKMHRLLRGRYVVTIILAALCAMAGAAAGYMSQKPKWRSFGLVEVKPVITDLHGDRAVINYRALVLTHVALLQDERVVQMAMSSDDWKSLGRGATPQETSDFVSALDVEYIPDSALVQVAFTDLDRDAARKATRAIILAYEQLYAQEMGNRDQQNKLAEWEDRMRKASGDITYNRRKIDDLMLSKKLGSVDLLAEQVATKKQRVEKLAQQHVDALVQVETIEGLLKMANRATTQPSSASRSTVEEIARVDQDMFNLLVQQRTKERELELLTSATGRGLGENHPQVQSLRSDLGILNRQIEEHAEMFRQTNVATRRPDASGAPQPVSRESLEAAQLQANVVQKYLSAAQNDYDDLVNLWGQVRAIQDVIADREAKWKEASSNVDELTVQMKLGARVQVISYGNQPLKPNVDRRKNFAVLGFLGGGAGVVVLFLLIGLLDQRYRYSDDAGTDMSGITLLGILPNLPDLLTDPDQAAIAAHCVHQIRTMLQINGTEERRAFSVTSAAPGDGKTSLTLALGLSFAASGSRTLLIDCDLTGGGLTARLNMITPDGVLEAISNRTLLEYIRTTDIADLAILPVGDARTHHASALSPAALRRLVADAKKHFDTVLIDTGPLLGSLEASAVCAAVDGVILVVARGQQRPLVEKAMQHLRAIGARLAGLVFNRAQARDFDRSVNRLSMARSISRHSEHGSDRGSALPRPGSTNGAGTKSANGASGAHGAHSVGQLGPVAKAVVSSVSGSFAAPTNGNGGGAHGDSHGEGH